MTYFTSNFKEIEAVQFINSSAEELEAAFFSNYPPWLEDAFNQGVIDCIFPTNRPFYLRISTREGTMDIISDWIIHSAKGELYPCKNHFRKR